MKFLKGIRVCWSKKVTQSIAQLTFLHTNTHGMGNKQQELEITVQQASYDLIAITEIRWNKSHDWSTAKCSEGVDRGVGERGLPSVQIKKKNTVCNIVESLWVEIRGQANKRNLVVGVYYRPLSLGEFVDKVFLLHTHSLWSCWETSITLTPAGKAAQQAVSNPGGSSSALRIVS